MALVGRGLDTSNPDDLDPEELEAYLAGNLETFGHPHRGLEFWLDGRADVLKRYRAQADRIPPLSGGLRGLQRIGFLAIYTHHGYSTGIRYMIRGMQRAGFSRSDVLEVIAVVFLDSITAPVGMERIAIALDDYEWIEPSGSIGFPEHWRVDREALSSGIDFATPATPADTEAIEQWYRRVVGEVPSWVVFIGRERPEVLKAHRNRLEHALRSLPVQVLPLAMLMSNVERSLGPGIRESVLLARGLGLTRAETVEAILHGALKGGAQTLDAVEAAAGDVLLSWN